MSIGSLNELVLGLGLTREPHDARIDSTAIQCHGVGHRAVRQRELVHTPSRVDT